MPAQILSLLRVRTNELENSFAHEAATGLTWMYASWNKHAFLLFIVYFWISNSQQRDLQTTERFTKHILFDDALPFRNGFTFETLDHTDGIWVCERRRIGKLYDFPINLESIIELQAIVDELIFLIRILQESID